MGYAGVAGNYILMMFYTTIAGWMPAYFYKFLIGRFEGINAQQIGHVFTDLIANPGNDNMADNNNGCLLWNMLTRVAEGRRKDY
jgi:SNF family Na+-dependent transporter